MRRRLAVLAFAVLLVAAFPAPADAWRIKASDRKVQVIADDGEENFIGVDIVRKFRGRLLIKVVDDEEKKVRIESTDRCSEGRRGHVFCFVDPAIREDSDQPITVDLGDGDDVFVNAEDIGVEVDGGEGDDAILGGEGTDVLEGGEGNDAISARESSDEEEGQVLRGDEGNDLLIGDDADETLEGGEGDDIINGGDGDDEENGGEGNDLLHARPGRFDYEDGGVDELIGGPGIDHADFRDSPLERAPVAGAVVKSGVRAVIGGEAVAYRSVQHPGLPEQVEELATDTVASDVEGLIGTPGEDRLSAENGVQAGGDEAGGPAVSALLGMDGDDELVGGPANDLLGGGVGNDLLQGNAGADKLDGGDGVDEVSYADAYHLQKATPVVVRMHDTVPNDGEVTTIDGQTRSEGDFFVAVENLVGGPSNDILLGTVGPNRISGGDGNDRIVGGAGVDDLSGDAGKDTLQAVDVDPQSGRPAADLVQCLAGDIVGVDRADILQPDTRGACERVYYKRGPVAAPVHVQLPAAGSVEYAVTDPLPAVRGGGRSLDFLINCGSAACSGRVVMLALPSRSPVGSRAFSAAPNGRRFVRVPFTPDGAELVDRPGPLRVVAVFQTRAGDRWVTRGTVQGTIGKPAAGQ